jgi:adenylosuccinate synthase
VRLGDLKHPEWLRARLEQVVARKNVNLRDYGEPPLSVDVVHQQCMAWQSALGDRIVDVLPMIRQAVQEDQNVLLEGQLGVMRDLDWGIYPYVTSSNPTAAYAGSGAGIPPHKITHIVGVVKAYSTCVGAGPFPVELFGELGDRLREVGGEFGATTGRPRRVGWFDGVAIDFAAWLNGFSEIAVTKLDILDGFPELKICTGYRLGGQVLTSVPDTAILEAVTPEFETWPGWMRSTEHCRSWEELPALAQAYLRRIEQLAGVPIGWVSVGAERERMFRV